MPGVKAGAKGTATSRKSPKAAFDFKKVIADRFRPAKAKPARMTINAALEAVSKMSVVEIIFWAGGCGAGFSLAKYGHDLNAAFDQGTLQFRNHMVEAAPMVRKEEVAARFKAFLEANQVRLTEKDKNDLAYWLANRNSSDSPGFDQSLLRNLFRNVSEIIKVDPTSPLYQDWKFRVVREYLRRAAVGYQRGEPFCSES